MGSAADATAADVTQGAGPPRGAPLDGRAAPPPGLRLSAGYWIVDPGVAKQSQDWVYAGPGPRRPSPQRRDRLPAALALTLALASLAGAAGLTAVTRRPTGADPATLWLAPELPWIAGLACAGALYLLLAGLGLARVWRRPRRSPREAPGRQNTVVESADPEPLAPAGLAGGAAGAAGVGDDDLDEADLPYDLAAGRQAWEGEIEVHRPRGWPDRPLVVAIGDGVSSALRSAEVSRLATRTAWYRTFFHLHALTAGAPPAMPAPWLVAPKAWPAPGPARDQLMLQAMSRAFGDANSAVILAGKRFRRDNPAERRPTATTLTVLALQESHLFLVHVGDCSAYRVRGSTGAAEPLQVEHNRAAAYAGRDPARYREARRQGMQNVLTRWVGMTGDWAALDAQVLDAPDALAPGDAVVLCSDGLDKHVTRQSIARAALALDARPAAGRLVALANDGGGSDHIAVAVLQAGTPPGRRRGRRGLWGEDLAGAWRRHRAGVAGLLLAGLLAGAAGAGAVLVARSVAAVTPVGGEALPAPAPPAPQPPTQP